MRIRFKMPWLMLMFWPLLSMAEAGIDASAAGSAQQVVRTTAEQVLSEVGARKQELESDPSLIYPLVENTVVPHFDFTSMTRSAMGRFWRKADLSQQNRLVVEFRELLVRTYATALLGYAGQTIDYPPLRAPEDADKVTVPTRISAAGGPPIRIDYRLKLDSRNEWLVYDVVIDNVSLVTNYRSSFARLIQQGAAREKDRSKRMRAGIDNLIESLASKNEEARKSLSEKREETA